MISLTDKIKELARLSKISGDYSQLSQLGVKLIDVQLNSILKYIGIRPNGNGDSSLCGKAVRINQLLRPMMNIQLIPEKITKNLYLLEARLQPKLGRSNDNDKKELSKVAFSIYFELKKISLLSDETIHDTPTPFISARGMNLDMGKSLMLNKLTDEERLIRKKLTSTADLGALSELQRIEVMKKTLNHPGKWFKRTIQGKVGENKSFQDHLENFPGFILIGLFLLLMALGVAVSSQAIIFPQLSPELSTFTLLFFGGAALMFYLYYNNYVKS